MVMVVVTLQLEILHNDDAAVLVWSLDILTTWDP